MHSSPIIIAGGGIAGLASALALGSRDVMLLEQAPEFSSVGAGLQLGPNAVRALQNLGAWDAVEPITSSPPEIHMRDGITGKLLKRLNLGKSFETRFGAPYRVAHRADLHRALLEVVRARSNIQLHLGEAVSHVEDRPDGVQIRTNGKVILGTALIAADGVHSKIRQHIFSGTSPVDSGDVFHRALLKVPNSRITKECVNLWLYPQGHVVHYPVGAEQSLNLIAVTPKASTARDHFKHAAPELRELLEAAAPNFTAWPGFYAPSLSSWVRGNTLLVGDAAHATLPYLAQGAAMALEDAATLLRVLQGASNIQNGFQEFQQQRKPRTSRLHRASLAAGKNYHHNGIMRLARNVVLLNLPNAALFAQLNWIYKY